MGAERHGLPPAACGLSYPNRQSFRRPARLDWREPCRPGSFAGARPGKHLSPAAARLVEVLSGILIMKRVAVLAAATLALGADGQAVAGPLLAARSTEEVFTRKGDDPYVLAVRAYIWGYPLVRAAQLRLNATRPDDPFALRAPSEAGAALNTLGRARQLASPATRIGVAPNNDTLYVLGFIDTARGAFVLETPDFGRRYYTIQFGQADTTTDVSLGQRTHGGRLPRVLLHGPSFRGKVPAGMIGVPSRQRYLMIAGRILVDGPVDLPAVHALQDGIRLYPFAGHTADNVPSAQRPLTSPASNVPENLRWAEMIGAVLRDWRVGPREKSLVASFRRIGISPERGFLPDRLDEAQRAAVAEGLADGAAIVRRKTEAAGHKVNGWSINYRGASFGNDFLLRAAVAMDQIYIMDAREALYASARVDAGGKALSGRNRYRLRFAPGKLPPIDAFWSVTMYHDKGFLVDNPIDRWSIGDRTPGLRHDADGSLDIVIQHDPPPPHDRANWLPAPEGGFMLLMRLYNPRAKMRDGKWKPPLVVILEANEEASAGLHLQHAGETERNPTNE